MRPIEHKIPQICVKPMEIIWLKRSYTELGDNYTLLYKSVMISRKTTEGVNVSVMKD